MPCRIATRRLWTARLMLEQRLHVYSAFVTLTFREEALPVDGSVSPRELQLFLKRLLYYREGEPFRYYGVGEYGDDTGRPHYHLCLFGCDCSEHWNPGVASLYGVGACRCVLCLAWDRGGIEVRALVRESAAYVAGYHTKKLTQSDDPRLEGKHPEFARMSLRPGIGAGAMEVFAGVDAETGEVIDERRRDLVLCDGDVPGAFRTDGKLWPLGRYLRRRFRRAVGLSASESSDVARRRGKELQDALRVPGARAAREAQREYGAARAERLIEMKSFREKKL